MQINLLPDLVVKRRREQQIRRWANLGLTGYLGFLGFLVVAVLGYQVFQTVRLNAAKNKHAEVNAQVNSPDNVAFRREALEVQSSLSALKELFNSQRKLSVIVKRVAELTPKGAQLIEISLGEDGQVSLSGIAGSYNEAGKMVVALRNSKDKSPDKVYFEEVSLVGANQSESGVAFSITALYANLGETDEDR